MIHTDNWRIKFAIPIKSNIMKNPFKNWFKRKDQIKNPTPLVDLQQYNNLFPSPKQLPDIIVDADVAFREPPSKKIAEIRKLFEPVKFDELEFEEEIADFALDLISKESKRKIIQIIKDDIKTRASVLDHTKSAWKNTEDFLRPSEEIINKLNVAPIPIAYGINPKTKQVGNMTDEDMVAFKAYWKQLEVNTANDHEKNREHLLYNTVAIAYPDLTPEEIIKFIKENKNE